MHLEWTIDYLWNKYFLVHSCMFARIEFDIDLRHIGNHEPLVSRKFTALFYSASYCSHTMFSQIEQLSGDFLLPAVVFILVRAK